VSATETDPVTPNNGASAQTTVSALADLSLTKTDSPDPVLAGGALTYTLTAHNNGPSGATGVTVTDNLPSGAAYVSASPSQGSCGQASGTVTCNLGAVASGASATVQIAVTAPAEGTITNTASVSAAETDPSSANNAASAQTTVTPVADLGLTKSDSPDPVLTGGTLTYSLVVQNNGPSAASGITLTDNLPTFLVYQSASPSQGTCAEASGTVTCSLGTVANGNSATVQIQVTPQTTGQFTNTASVQSTATDLVSGNNQASETTTVLPSLQTADLSLTKTDSSDPIPAGATLTYDLAVHNNGPSDGTGVTMTDNLPSGVSYQSATSSQGSCSESGGSVTCNLGEIPAGNSVTISIRVTPLAAGTITNTASVHGGQTDPAGGNNSASEETTVTAGPDLALTKSDSPDPAFAGGTLTYTLTAHNNGPPDATGVTVTDNLPSGVTYQSATPSQGTCGETSGTVTCDLGGVANAGGATVTIVVTPQSAGTITNTASVQAAGDPVTSNNSATEQTTIDPVADMSLTKSDSPDPVQVDTQLTYTLTAHNNGPSDAASVNVTDNLPTSVAFVSATPSQGSCGEASGTVSCSLGSIASGNSATVVLHVTPQSTGTITNNATVQAGEHDPTTANNSASESTSVVPNGYARPKAATPSSIRLVPAYDPCGNGNAVHGGPWSVPSCDPPVQSSDFLTVGTPDANGQAANSTGVISLKVVGESPIDPSNGDQADVNINAQITDVRRRSDLSDYTGELQGVLGLRVTDRLNGPAAATPATATDVSLRFPVTCVATISTAGGDCNVVTTADTIMPGVVTESKRAVWVLSNVKIYDGGADGIAGTPDNKLFEVQGLFVP
jgi:uncharacterized repeat protein (TIGR01451 family)